MKHLTEGELLVHLVDAAQVALDEGDNELARHLVALAYTGFDRLQRELEDAAWLASIEALTVRIREQFRRENRRESDLQDAA